MTGIREESALRGKRRSVAIPDPLCFHTGPFLGRTPGAETMIAAAAEMIATVTGVSIEDSLNQV